MTQTGASVTASSLAAKGTASVAPIDPNASLTAAEGQRLIDHINARHDLQTAFTAAPKPNVEALKFWRKIADAIGHFFEGVASLFQPLAPAMPWILGILAVAIVAFLLSPVVRLLITSRFQRLFARDHLREEAPWRPTRDAVVALLGDIDALAAKGDYDQAVHLLLVRSVADINTFRPDVVRKHYSARDILTHPLLPEAARPAFAEIVRWVEKSYFAGIPVGKAGFDACRAAYVAFLAAEGIA